MPDSLRPQSIADLPAQKASAPKTEAQRRGRFFNPGNAFNVILPPVPDKAFTEEPAKALNPATPTGLIHCDAAGVMECPFPATAPLVLASYARVRAGETLNIEANATGVIYYVIEGAGAADLGGESLDWAKGDVFLASGGGAHVLTAGAADAVLWVVSNEPQLAHEHSRPPAPEAAPSPVVHYTADEIQRQIDFLYDVGKDAEVPGTALIFSSNVMEESRNAFPTLTLAMNTLDPGVVQRPHRHNSVAVSLVVAGDRCFSMIDGKRKDWSPWCTTITPPVSVHSHHNEGGERAFFLIVQDGGFYYHARAMGFEFVDD